MSVLFELLKDVRAQSLQSSKVQTDLVEGINSIRESQKSLETKMNSIEHRLDEFDNQLKELDGLYKGFSEAQKSIDELTSRNNFLQSRLDELEDRSRRNNLIFHGIPDLKETWQQTESKLINILNTSEYPLLSGDIERAHRLGTYSPNKCRPVIAKFTNYKTREKIFSMRNRLKESNISITEDFSTNTRTARKKLIDFGKSQPGSPLFKLHYNKLSIGNKHYIYDVITDSVQQTRPQATRGPHSSGPSSSASQ